MKEMDQFYSSCMRVHLISILCIALVGCNSATNEAAYQKKQFVSISEGKNKADVVNSAVATYASHYENGIIKLIGPGFEKFYRSKILLNNGAKLKVSPDLNSKSIATVPFDTELFQVIPNPSHEKWVFVKTEFYLNPGDDGYSEDLIEPTQFEGYIQSNSISKQLDSTKKSGIWKYFNKSGSLEKEEYHHKGLLIKKINFDKEGNVVEIEEFRNHDVWESFVKVSFHKNGKIKTISDAEDGGVVGISFDEDGNEIENMYGSKETKSYLEKIKLSKDIREFFLPENKYIQPYLINN